MPTSPTWAFRSKLRRRAFNWRGTRRAIDVIKAALAEITRAARSDPALAGEGAVLFLEKVSPAIREIDSSSGALGSAMDSAVSQLVPLIAAAPVARPLREKWLERLFEAYQEDDPPYIESLGDRWGELCAGADLAAAWADRLLPGVQLMLADRRKGVYAYTRSTPPCLSALFSAGRLDELLEVLASDPRPFPPEQVWAARVHAARGDVDRAVQTLDALRSPYIGSGALAALAEQFLIDAGRADEAYRRYALEARAGGTYLAQYRAIARRYPDLEPDRILNDLIASTPGDEGRWFATAKTLGRHELALTLARQRPVDPKTLLRASEAQLKSKPAFALEVAQAALRWMAAGEGYEISAAEVWAARGLVRTASAALGTGLDADALVAQSVVGEGAAARWVRECLESD